MPTRCMFLSSAALLALGALLILGPLLAFAPAGTAEDAGTEAARAEGWSPASPRDEIAPQAGAELVPGSSAPELRLGLAGKGDEAVDGRWEKSVPVEAGKWYRFGAEYRASDVETPLRSILARIVWLDGAGAQVDMPEYPSTARAEAPDDWTEVAGTFLAPAKAARARLELHLRWAPRGSVTWRRARLEETVAPPSRKVRVAAVNHRPGGGTPRGNVERFAALVEEAARQEVDFVCLPEGITVVGTGKSYADVAEPVPGPSTEVLGAAAARRSVHVIAGIYERDGRALYNTAVLLGRDGKLAGKYRKLCLPREEIEGGITPGRDYPVFATDRGKVGMMICWDVHFPEVARELSARGAEIIFLPIWGGNRTLAQARAIENQVFLVASGYDFTTAAFDRTGAEVARAAKDPEIIVVEMDLAERQLWPWLGDWRSRIWREAPVKPEGAAAE